MYTCIGIQYHTNVGQNESCSTPGNEPYAGEMSVLMKISERCNGPPSLRRCHTSDNYYSLSLALSINMYMCVCDRVGGKWQNMLVEIKIDTDRLIWIKPQRDMFV